ncbi:leukotriene A-4 hydrolase-like [Acipenser oxyrinchus oxyrinchus]|uniref:Leukotriene A(4) hydrolase n=1 Tax=Acipenser oxyrinchus oxyrinchus TaxID=40147 RepID=A0AAD8DGP4_ACIOX|nr:leukotriene A-4 hydrolase-like [Acipenser oxyrinchus oxyrinchus]
MATVTDPSSLASFSKCITRHLNLRFHVDFDRHVIKGNVALTIEALEDKLSSLILDTKDLKINKVTANGQDAKFTLGAAHSFNGSPLEITLPFELSRGQHVIIEVSYETSPQAFALQWLTPEQTAGKKHPYLFSQCQATHCRTMVPCQDTPSVKHTYYAQVSVPKELVAVMSAVRDGQEADPKDSSRTIYRFRQAVAMPSYLIAIVVGALESREIGPRTRVWSEKELVDLAAYEFAETEAMLKTAEQLAGPYVWGQYDLLVLPPSFPYGGMENPCLTFATPTLLAGDRSLSSVIAHEIAHSWTGNLVTTKTWEHFWLNEGHTVYLERMIAGRMFNEPFRQFKAMGGWKELQDSINTFGAKNPLTNLVPDLNEVNTDEAFSLVPYEKGFALLYHLEELLGGSEVFMGFVKSYIQMFAHNSVSTDDWKNYLYKYFTDKVDILNKVDWNGWMHTPGMPPVKTQYDTTLADACIALCKRWIKASEADLSSFSAADLQKLSSHQVIEFLALLLHEEPIPLSHVKRMQEVYNLNAVKNSEIRFRWLRVCVRAKWEEAVPLAFQMATEQGRMKFTRPLFRELYNFDKYREQTVSTFLKCRSAMHAVTAMLVAKDLKIDQGKSTAL